MMLLDGRSNRIIETLLILAIVFNLIGLQPTQCASQEDLKSLINSFNSLSKEEQSAAAMEIFKNYKDYQELRPWEINRQAAQAIDDQMVDMTKEIWRDVSCKKGGIDYIVPVGTLGNRNDPESKYIPGKSDKDFIPMGSGAGDAADNFNKAFNKKFGLDPATLDINVLDPTKIETWPDRVKAFSNPEKYNTLGGNKWLQGDMYEKNPDVWLTHPLSGDIDEGTYRGMTCGKPPDLVPEDAAGFYSDNLRFRNRLKDLDPETRMLKQSKYDLRNVEAFKTAGGTLTTADEQLVAAADKASNGLTKEAIEEYGKSLGLSGDAALERYLADMDSLTERMGKKCLAPLLEKASMGAMSGVAKIELGGVLANLPESTANKIGEELAKGTVNKQVWDEALVTASTLRSSSSTMGGLSDQLDSISKQRYGKSYNELSNSERLAIHGAVEESADFASKLASLAKGGFIVAGAGFAGWAIYDAYQEGKKEGRSGLSQATGRAVIELIEAGCPAVGIGELIGRLTAMGVDWQISAFKDNQLDKLYDQYKSDKNLDDALYDAEFKNSGSASALRQLAIEERKKNPGLSDSDIEAKVKAYLKDYLKLRLDTEKAVGQYEDLKARMESWVNKNEIPLEPGSDSVTARIDNSRLSKDEYEFLMAELMKKYYHIQSRLTADHVPFVEKDILNALWQIYRGDPEGLDNYMRNLYHNAGKDKLYNSKYAKNYLARIVTNSGGNLFVNRGNLSGRDPLGFLNCLCTAPTGVWSGYEPNPAGDCRWGNWGINRGPLPTVSDLKNNSCAASYGITEMRTNKTPLQPIAPGALLNNGDQIQTTGKAVLAMADGSRLLANPNSVLTFTKQSSGKILVDVQQGGARIISSPGGASNLEVRIGDKKIRPKGTEYTAKWDGTTGNVAVIEGSVTLTNETLPANESSLTNTNASSIEPEISLQAGWQLETPSGKISPYNLSTDDGGLFVGLPLRELLLNDSDPQPYGTYGGAFADGKIPEDWIWQDPGSDAKKETPENGTLKVTVPDGNDLLGGHTDAPRLLHKVTGDFDLEAELLLKSNGTNYAVTQFVLYSPGSNLGILTNQMDTNGLAEDYWVGGGWQKQAGVNKLSSFNKDLKDCTNASDNPVKLKITRHNDVLKTYWSLDGRQWSLSTRQEFNISDTVWVGWVFKRIAYDGLNSEPAVNTLRGVKLVTAPLGSMEVPGWDLAPGFGEALAENSSIRLALNGSVLGDTGVYSSGPFEGDLDAVVHFDTANWTGQVGERRDLALFAANGDNKNLLYIGLAQDDIWYGSQKRRYETDRGYQYKETSDHQGYLRIVRHNGNFTTYYLSKCQWIPLGELKPGFTDPVYIRVSIDNQASKPVPLAVDFKVEQILAGEAVSGNWTPTYCGSNLSGVGTGNIGTHVTFKPGSIWKVKEYGPMGNWDGEWVIREDAQTIDASWSGGSITDIIDIKSIEGDQITLYRHGNNGYYTGTISPDGLSMSGTASWYSPGETWTATRIEGTSSVIPGGYTAYNGPEATSTPTAQLKNFKFKPWGQYDVIEFLGDKYFAAYDPTVTADVANAGESVAFLYDHSWNRNLMGNKQISKVLIDSSNETTITSTSPLELEEGYQLAIKSVDVKGIKAYLELSKNGLVVDFKVVQPSIDNAKMSDQTYYYRTDLGATSGIIQIAVHFKNAFAGPGTNIATVDGVFQISDTVTPLTPQNSLSPESNNNPEKNVQGECHKDPVTGRMICIDTIGDLSRQQGSAQGQMSSPIEAHVDEGI